MNTQYDISLNSEPGLPDRIIRLPEAMHLTGHCRSTLYDLLKNGRFPRQRKIGKRSVGFSYREIQEYIRVTLAGGEQQTAKDKRGAL
jgi:prophage regulatory protein